ncbi:DUF4388 domain-containing protein [candidate division KSB1 bacterium]|nr:DUF4388 domain-containing protein [candidate division KSB1 bacterium]
MITKLILVIMSDKSQKEQVQQQLETNDFEVITASDGKSGFELARKTKPDLILAATQLDKLDGIDLCFMIRQNERLAAIPYILLVDVFSLEERINSYRSGVDAIVQSDISDRELCTRIDALIKRHEPLTYQNLQANQSLIGKIDDFLLIEVIQMLNMNQKTGLLNILHQNQHGQIVFYEGNINWANLNDTFGEEAIEAMVFWKEGHFIFEKNLVQQDANINKPTMQLILDCCQLLDETKAHENEEL